MKAQLVCTFVKKYQIDQTLKEIKDEFSVLNNRLFLLKSVNVQNELILSYNVLLDSYHEFLSGSILVHRKTETNTIYTINALNELIMDLNNGILDKRFPIEWERYQDTLLLKRPDGLKLLKIETIKVYNI